MPETPAASSASRRAATAAPSGSAQAALALQRAAGNRAVGRLLARKGSCPSAAEVGLPTKVPPGQPPQCGNPSLRRCGDGPREDVTTYLPDGEGGYLTCKYHQSSCECYDKDPSLDYYEGIWNLWGLWGGKPKLVGGYNTWSLASDDD